MTLSEIPRNDMTAAWAYHDARGHVSAEEFHVLMLLQDDQIAFVAQTKTWKVLAKV